MPKPSKGPRLGGSPAHERIILANLASQLFEHGRITTTETRARRVQPVAEKLISKAKRGAVIPQKGKTRITIYLDDEVLKEFRNRAEAAGRGYQTMINEALRAFLARADEPVDKETLRLVIREELAKYGRKKK